MKKAQNPKPRNQALSQAMQELRASNAASPHINKKRYTRKEKYGARYV